MSIKTIASYTCALFSVLVIILALATNYWVEYVRNDFDKKKVLRFRAGLWERCDRERASTAPEKDSSYTDWKCEAYKPTLFSDWEDRRNAVVAMYILAVISTLIAFVFVTVYCVTDKYYFPVKRSAILFLFAGAFVVIGLAVYTNTYINVQVDFSWSYGAGWSAAAMYIISMILLMADK